MVGRLIGSGRGKEVGGGPFLVSTQDRSRIALQVPKAETLLFNSLRSSVGQ